MRNRTIRFTVVSISIFLATALLLTGCSSEPPAPELEPVTISFSYPQVDQPYYQKHISDFQKAHPHITIEPMPRINDSSGGQDPDEGDVFIAPSFTVNALREEGRVLNLTPFLEGNREFDRTDYFSGSIDIFSGQGQVWAIPAGADPMVMYYNIELLDIAGAPVPHFGWTWDDFLAIAQTASDPGGDIFGYGPIGYNSGSNFADLLHFIYQHDGRILDNLNDPTRVTFDDPATIEAVEWYVDLINTHHVSPTPQEVRAWNSRYGIYVGILRGKVVMWMGAFSEQGGQTWPSGSQWDTWDWGMIPLPRDAQSITSGLVEGYAISTEANHINECWQWIEYLSNQIPNNRLVPVKKSVFESNTYRQTVGDVTAAVAQEAMETMVLYPDVPEKFYGPMGYFSTAVNKVINRELTPEDAMRWAQQEAENQLTQ